MKMTKKEKKMKQERKLLIERKKWPKILYKFLYIWEELNNMIKEDKRVYMKTHTTPRNNIWIYTNFEITIKKVPLNFKGQRFNVTVEFQKTFIQLKTFDFQFNPLHHFKINNETMTNLQIYKKLMFTVKKEWERMKCQAKEMERYSHGWRPYPKYWREKERRVSLWMASK